MLHLGHEHTLPKLRSGLNILVQVTNLSVDFRYHPTMRVITLHSKISLIPTLSTKLPTGACVLESAIQSSVEQQTPSGVHDPRH